MRKLSQPFRRTFITYISRYEFAYRKDNLWKNIVDLTTGLHLYTPLIHTIYRIKKDGCVPLRELDCFTSDNVQISVSGTLFYRVFDGNKACFEIPDNVRSLVKENPDSNAPYHTRLLFATCSMALRDVISKFEYREAVEKQQLVNDEVYHIIKKSIGTWGVDCERFEINVLKLPRQHVAILTKKKRIQQEDELNNEVSGNIKYHHIPLFLSNGMILWLRVKN